MQELYSHKVLNSFYLWFDHTLLTKATAFQNTSGNFYYTPDARLPDSFLPYASPFKQWVSDSSVPNAIIPTGVYVNGNLVGRPSGIKFDWDNGRVLLDSGNYDSSEVVSGNYSTKDFNTYVVSNEDTKMVFDGNYQLNSRYNMMPKSGISPYGYAAPACFIMNTATDNKPFAFGGEQDTKNKMRVIVVSDSIYHLDGVISLFRDLTESIFPLVTLKDDPINEYGDLKTGVYNYDQLSADNAGRYVFIERVTALKITTSSDLKINPNLKFGILDFYLSDPRVPKLDL